MSAPPIPSVWTGEAFAPLPNFLRVAREHYGQGEVVALTAVEDRSGASHRHFFASVNEAWQNLSEADAARFPTPDALRKYALVRTGYFDAQVTVCMFKTEALRLAAWIKPDDDYSIVTVEGKVVTVYRAKSQSVKAMGKEQFGASKDAVLGFLADMIGVDVAQLSTARAA